MTDDDKMDALLRQMAVDDYNRPPEIVPREQMWDVVLQGLGQPAAGDLRDPLHEVAMGLLGVVHAHERLLASEMSTVHG